MNSMPIFLSSCAIFFFEIVCARFLGFSIGTGFELIIIGLAMLGICSAGSVVACIKPGYKFPKWTLGITIGLLAISFQFLFVANYYVVNLSQQTLTLAKDFNFKLSWLPMLAGVMFIPYMLFGIYITIVFRTCKNSDYSRIYFWDMAGGAIGCCLAYLCMEYGSFTMTMVLPTVLCLIGTGFAIKPLLKKKASFQRFLMASAIYSIGAYFLATQIEPSPNLDLLARNFKQNKQIKELWHSWNSFSRIGLVEQTSKNGHKDLKLQLGSGEGEARLGKYPPQKIPRKRFAMLSTTLNKTPKALVLMAGSGFDMMGIDKISHGKADVTGVELNSRMKEGALLLPQQNMAKFYAKPNVHYVIDEARAYLNKSKEKFDIILSSFSGATVAYYAGSIGQTTQFVYTKEAMGSMISRLSPDGMLIFVNTNKARLIENLKVATPSPQIPYKKQVMLLGKRNGGFSHRSPAWDSNILMIKPSGFSRADEKKLQKAANKTGYHVLLAPYRKTQRNAEMFAQALSPTANYQAKKAKVGDRYYDLSATSDNSPFIFDTKVKEGQFSFVSLKRILSGDVNTIADVRILFAAFISLLGIILIGGPLVKSGGLKFNTSSIQHLVYFAILGVGFMLIEIGLVHKMSLALGPGLTLPFVLGGIVFFTALGALFSSQLLHYKRSAIMAVVALLGIGSMTYFFYESIIYGVLDSSLSVRVLVTLAVISPMSMLMGIFMPVGLSIAASDDVRLSGWCWGINGVFGTITASLSIPFAGTMGFSSMVGLGLCCYGGILLLPRYWRGVISERPILNAEGADKQARKHQTKIYAPN